ncbi:hypothetical protein J7444_00615 [Labrenzia sp. R4_1]|uniref:hypothetical protein n=1 Tax=Labrenzia sp. R4_1 TaxID=2821106 RepID=UPI001ADA58E6|nr:hypothetical protein [Labrenzia sp. R4_1]MBO9423198.1 hypothetical protein [Labrenzia sp. R4_1]
MVRSWRQMISISRKFHDAEVVSPHERRGLPRPPIQTPDKFEFSVLKLALAIGRAVCSRNAPAGLLRAQARSSIAALKGVCDFKSGKLQVNDVIKRLNEIKRKSIAHDIGVGITVILMREIGYSWVGLTEDHLKPSTKDSFRSSKSPDLVFDQGEGAKGYAVVEAKGSVPIGAYVAPKYLENRLRTACTAQVANVLGATSVDGTRITRGIAIGCLAKSGGDAATFGCIEADPGGTSNSKKLSLAIGYAPTPLVAFRHYIGALRLIGADQIADILFRRLAETAPEFVPNLFDEPVAQQRLEVRPFQREEFIVGEPMNSIFPATEFSKNMRFALSLRVFVSLLDNSLKKDQIDDETTSRLSLDSVSEISSEAEDPELLSFVDFDGFAILSEDEFDVGPHRYIVV